LIDFTSVPPKGSSLGWDERKKSLGNSWALLTEDEKNVFDSRVFAHFSKLPITSYNPEEDESESEYDEETNENEPKALLDKEEVAIYEPLYEKLVNHEKVQLVSGQASDTSTSSSPQAMKHILRINSDVSHSYITFLPTSNAEKIPSDVHYSQYVQPQLLLYGRNTIPWVR